jgi:hypothetical protein
MTLLLRLPLLLVSLLVLAPSASSQKTLIDDFSSGAISGWNFEDGFAVTGLGVTTYSVIGGEFSLAGPAITPIPFRLLTGAFTTDSVDFPGDYADGAVYAKVSLLGPNSATIGMRGSSGGVGIVFGYVFEMEDTGGGMLTLRIRRYDGLGGDAVVASGLVPWAGGAVEVITRCVGASLSMRVWDAGAPEPYLAGVSVVDANYASGAIGVGMLTKDLAAGPFEARFDDISFAFPQGVPVVINEVLADPIGADDGRQFVELKGPAGTDLSGWRLREVDGSAGSCQLSTRMDTLPDGATIGPDGLYVIADATAGVSLVAVDAGHNGGLPDLLIEDFDLDDDDAGMHLLDAAFVTRDAVGRAAPFLGLCSTTDLDGYPTLEARPAVIPPAGFSLGRLSGAADSDDNAVDVRPNGCPSPGTDGAGCPGVWADLGLALAGATGDPVLSGAGPLTGSTSLVIVLANALPLTSVNLVLGFSNLNLPFKGGVLVPSPDILFFGLPVDQNGTFALSDTWPAGIPAGLPSYFQYWISDPVGPKGFSTSNGLSGTSQ